MIKQFNKNGAVALYKREFVACLENEDYEGAIDKLIKYSDATGNPDFHAAMGVLYFLMTQDSDDRELLPLSHREFMMHIVAHPNDVRAYRNLLAVAILRHDAVSIAEISEWIKKRGLDVTAMVNELSELGLDIFNDDVEYIDIDSMFTAADYGEIMDGDTVAADTRQEQAVTYSAPAPKQKSKVISFKGSDKSVAAASDTVREDKIIRIKNDDGISEDKLDLGEMFDMMISLVRGDGDKDGDIAPSVEISDDATELKSKIALRNAQGMCVSGDYEKALTELDTIDRDTGRLYYCAECVRCNIMMDLNKIDEAQAALDRAFAVVPDGALGGTLQCSLYEIKKEFDKIPATLKNIDVADYVDSDHVYRAMRMAVKYCTREEAMELAEEYIDEFNSFDLRSCYAQLMYNAGDRKSALKELYGLSRILYDDFNAQYYYLLAKSGVDVMPIEDETPQKVLGLMVDNIVGLVRSELFTQNDEIIQSEPFKYGLEVFLTLEFRHSRNIVKIMFETLNTLAADMRLESVMRNALVSPYVEPLVKAVIIGRLLGAHNGKTGFLTELSFCPISDETLPALPQGCGEGVYTAYALTALYCRRALPFFIEYVQKLSLVPNDNIGQRDIAYFLWRTVKTHAKFADRDLDGRLHYALGYDSKGQANDAYKTMSTILPKP